MMRQRTVQHPVFGQTLFCDNGIIEIGVPLEFGLRVGHFSFLGEENVFFVQPNEMQTFSTEEGWRLRGGHRLWVAPESEKVYAPDNDPISYGFEGDTLVLTQKADARLGAVKSFRISMQDSTVTITHRLTNISKEEMECSLWAISVMAPGGVETIAFERRDGGMDHWHRISMWDYTSLGDPRAHYTRDEIRLTYMPLDEKYKIGVGHPSEPVRYENNGVVFVKQFTVEPNRLYPDANVSYETFFSKYMVEMESLSPLVKIPSGEFSEHTETWQLIRK